ncbi:MAG: VIT domain-containing protein [Planctomycetota bacterium]|nr:VIT domain-containing protein [Planctomycetota bacterium]
MACLSGGLHAQSSWSDDAGNFVVPQMHSVVVDPAARRLHVAQVHVEVDITQQVATTTMDIDLKNPSTRQQEAQLLVPVPDGAIVRGFDFEGAAAEPTARILPADEARSTYASIVYRSKDPALLEFAGYNTIRSSVFPVPAGGTQKVRLVYEHILPTAGDRVDYTLPRSESLSATFSKWTITVRIRSNVPISTVYSPSHEIEKGRVSKEELWIRVEGDAARAPGAFQLSYLLQGNGINASIYAYPDARVGGGYFLLLAGLPVEMPAEAEQRKREVIFVLDTSGSMQGEKFEQARAAALHVLEGLDEGEAFNIVDYNTDVHLFAPDPVIKSAETMSRARNYLELLRPGGGTNLSYGLQSALRQDHHADMLPLVLFLTDGLPTVGEQSETVIREDAVKYNAHGRRIFTFGVGYDVNVPLLDHLAQASRATSEFIEPQENVEQKVSRVFNRLHGPVLARPELRVFDASGKLTTSVVRDLLPGEIGDLYEDDQLIVLGKYTRAEHVTFQLEGDYFGKQKSFRFDFDLARSSITNSFVPRLWASRRIAVLIDEIRQSGADSGSTTSLLDDPRTAELTKEILDLSMEFGILTEYTAFLALEGTDLGAASTVLAQLGTNLKKRARMVRVGRAALNQSTNVNRQRVQNRLNRANAYLNANMDKVSHKRVQQVSDRSFFKRHGNWVDARLFRLGPDVEVAEVLVVGTKAHRDLVDRLVAENRQGILALRGNILMELDGRAVLIQAPEKPTVSEKKSTGT